MQLLRKMYVKKKGTKLRLKLNKMYWLIGQIYKTRQCYSFIFRYYKRKYLDAWSIIFSVLETRTFIEFFK